MKKVLMICYAFPPMGGSGVQRSLKFAKYLPENGWQPVVLAGSAWQGRDGDEHDNSLLAEFPADGLLYRAPTLDGLGLIRGMWTTDPVSNEITLPGQGTSHGVTLRLLRGARRLWQTSAYIPDERAGWLLPALCQAIRVMRRHRIEVVYSSSDPYTAHIVAYLASRLAGKPWIADFRDPWTQYDACYKDRGSYRRKIDELLEQFLLSRPDRVIVVSDEMRELFVEKYIGCHMPPITVITNGFDEDDFSEAEATADGKFTVVYAGRFNWPATESPYFLRAVRLLLDEHPEISDDFIVRFVGAFGAQSERLVGELDLGGTVQWVGYRPHAECIREMVSASALLLTINKGAGSQSVFTGKLFEYLAAKKPILAAVPESAAARLIRETGSGVVVPPEDVVGTKNALYQLCSSYRSGRLHTPSGTCLEEYSRRHLTRKLAGVLEGFAG